MARSLPAGARSLPVRTILGGMLRALVAAALAVSPVSAAGVEPRSDAAEYPVHAKVESLAIGAEYLVHSVSGQGQTYVAPDYLVVEVAVFPLKPGEFTLSAGNFSLRINGKKIPLLPQTPGIVAASLKYPDWEDRPRVEAGAGIGDAGVILGRPQPVERFPGDTRPGRARLPAPPRAPTQEDPSGLGNSRPVSAEEVVVESALPEGEFRGPVAGCLYFAYKGKTKSIRSLELLYSGPAGPAALRLR